MSELLRILLLLFSMQDDDIAALSTDILEQRKKVWLTALKEQAARYGCTRTTPRPPSRGNLADLKRMSASDAKSIAKTYNRDIQREIERLYQLNPRGNRNYYYKNLQSYINRRTAWKSTQIALNTETQTRAYAQEQFRQNNDLRGRYLFIGPPPVCDDCTRLYTMGLVSEGYTHRFPNPQHINCLHEWQLSTVQRLDCRDIWLG